MLLRKSLYIVTIFIRNYTVAWYESMWNFSTILHSQPELVVFHAINKTASNIIYCCFLPSSILPSPSLPQSLPPFLFLFVSLSASLHSPPPCPTLHPLFLLPPPSSALIVGPESGWLVSVRACDTSTHTVKPLGLHEGWGKI